MKRLGAIFIPMLAGFLLTVATVSWRSGWWQEREALGSAATAPVRVEVRQPNLRIVPVHVTVAPPARVAAAVSRAGPLRPPTEGEPAPVSEPLAPPPVPRANAGNSPDMEAPVRKFARGSSAGEE